MRSPTASQSLSSLIHSESRPHRTRSEAAKHGGKPLIDGICSWCRKGKHTRCFSLKCKCETCNPPLVLR